MNESGYVYLGSDVAVHADDIIGIFDIERTSVTANVRDFLRGMQKSGGIYYVSLDLPKSYIVCEDVTFVSNVSVATLRKRLQFGQQKCAVWYN